MDYQSGSALLCLSGIAIAVVLFLLGGKAQRIKRCARVLLYQVSALVFGMALIRQLSQALSPYACSRLSHENLLFVGGLAVLHLIFILHLAVWIKRQKTKESGGSN